MRTRRLWGSVVVGALVLVTWALLSGGWRVRTSPEVQAVRDTGTPHASRASIPTASPRPSAGLRIRGTVVDTRGVPVAGVRVAASWPEAGQTLSELPCPEQPGDDPRRPSIPSGTLPQCVHLALELIMELIGAREGEAPIHAETTTGVDGAFVLEGLREGPLALWALGERGAGMRSGIPAGSEGVELVLDSDLMARGTVTGDGVPLTGASVTVVDLEHPRFFDATTRAEGDFHLGPLPRGGRYVALIAKEGWLPTLLPIERLHAVTLHRPGRLSVRVLSDGVPVPGAEVRRVHGGLNPGDFEPAITTDAEGRFTWVLSPGAYTLSASSGGRYALARVTVGTASPEVVLELGSALHVEGTVSDDEGRPVAGATVEARPDATFATNLRAVTGEPPSGPGARWSCAKACGREPSCAWGRSAPCPASWWMTRASPWKVPTSGPGLPGGTGPSGSRRAVTAANHRPAASPRARAGASP